MRKSVWLCVVMLLVMSLMTGCGGEKKGTTETAAKQESLTELLAKGRNLPGLAYDFSLSGQDMGMSGKMWVSGQKMKTETVVQGQKMIMIIDGASNVVYNYLPEQNMAMKIAYDPTTATKTPTQISEEMDITKAKFLETATCDGVKCKVVQVQEPEGKTQSKIWIREDYGLPVRVEMTDSTGNKTVMEYKNLRVGAIPADTFALPADVPVTDMSDMLKQLP